MCSIGQADLTEIGLTEIGLAIDRLAADYREAAKAGRDDEIAERLARIWIMLSELDPELARRLPGYGFPS
jgi:hypothetical protein